ncbi:MAG: alpha/beta hydrolase [Anaerolineae bacterium]|nr:alpha/beta hydrolase [Anaerolineae bacterium]
MPTLQVRDIEIQYTERGDGPTVVALHAATSNGSEMGWLAHLITHEGFNVVTPDLRGHGATHNPAPDLHLPRLVDDMLEFIYLLGRPSPHIVGFSLGGAVALRAAYQRPDMFRSLILLGTNYRAPGDQKLLQALGAEETRTAEQQAIFNPQTGVIAGWDGPIEALGVIACPVLIIAADRDEFHDPEDSLVLFRALPHAEVLIVPRCDHIGLVRHPLVMEAVRGFYTRVPR